ncbi:ureidoglycolate lyase [Acinetobacter sp.]|uniref:ureidoglycolate lyase n=1 Tax=Acinetobacter sp. TaxID=472 RepID=UPI00388F196D
MNMQTVKIQPLTAGAFLPYGEVIACQGNHYFHINEQQTERYHALAEVETDAKAGLSIFRNIQATAIPFEISMLERHPLGSQTFIPMQGQQFLIIVAPALNHEQPDLGQIQVFMSDGSQGINYRAGTWHHPLLTLEVPSDFVVVDRIGTGPNCDVYTFPQKTSIVF